MKVVSFIKNRTLQWSTLVLPAQSNDDGARLPSEIEFMAPLRASEINIGHTARDVWKGVRRPTAGQRSDGRSGAVIIAVINSLTASPGGLDTATPLCNR